MLVKHLDLLQLIHIQITKFTSIDFSDLVRNRAALVGIAIVNGEKTKITTSYTFTTRHFSSYLSFMEFMY